MRSVSCSCLLILISFFSLHAQQLVSIKSPDKNIELNVYQNKTNITYSIQYKGKEIIKPSSLGLVSTTGDLHQGLKLTGTSGIEKLSDEYELFTGKKSQVNYTANKTTIHLSDAGGRKLNIIFQVSNDGVAFRYHIPEAGSNLISIKEEKTSFVFDTTTIAFLQPMQVAKTGFEKTNPAYEDNYLQHIPAGTPSPSGVGWVYPSLFRVKDTWVLLTEAGMDGKYCGTRLVNEKNEPVYKIAFPDPREVMTTDGLLPSSPLPFYSPWRVITIGSLATIIESTLGTDVAAPSIKMDKSFILPGKSSWSWIMSKDDFITYEEQKKYIDFAADMHWQYCLIDAAWDAKIGYDSIRSLSAYAKRKGVGLLLWYNSAGDWNTVAYTPKNKMLTHESRVQEFSRLKDMGIKGVKIDFFGGDGRSVIQYYIDILEDAAAYGLLVNFHGATLPRGWSRTYPHLLTTEAVKGFEMVTFNQQDANRQANHSTILPFTRNAFDPMDFTPMNLYKIGSPVQRKTTSTFELATAVIFLSGIQHFAESPEGMSHVPPEIKTVLQELPVRWDDVKFISGFPGKDIVLARRSKNKWYIAGINGEANPKTLSIDLTTFSNKMAILIGDGETQLDFTISKQLSGKSTTVTMKANGGFLIILDANTRNDSALRHFPLSDVRLLESPFFHAQQTDMQYILSMDADRLLAPYLREAGLTPKAQSYGNWENSGLDGHTGGHYLSALANMYAATGNEKIQQRLHYMLDQLELCQQQNKNGYIGGIPGGAAMWKNVAAGTIDANGFSLNGKWVPLYNIHKLFAGLLDAWQLTGSYKAGKMLIKLADWFQQILQGLSDEKVQEMLRSEHGGLNEIFASISIATGDEKYLRTAQRISHRAILNPLLQQKDSLTGLHANTQIPKVTGFTRIADAGGDSNWRNAAAFFWQTVVENRTVSIGGNSVQEHFHPATDFSPMIEDREGPETCNTYNMMKLTKNLFLYNPQSRYIDYYEKAIYNHILSSQHPDGGFVYFTPMRPRHYRVYSQVHESFWCCVGSGIENHGKYGELIYAHNNEDLFINLFIPSTLNWKEKGLQLEQQTKFPYSNSTVLKLTLDQPKSFNMYIRYPSWVKEGKLTIKVNGNLIAIKKNGAGYCSIKRTWKSGDMISLIMPMELQLDSLPDRSPWISIRYGPVVLGAATDTSDMKGLHADAGRMSHIASGPLYPLDKAPLLVSDQRSIAASFKPVPGKPLHFTAVTGIYPPRYRQLELKPFFEIHDSRYMIYWRRATVKEYEQQQIELAKKEKELLALEAITLDRVSPGEQQPESDHQFLGEQSQTGLFRDRHWRKAKDWFSYVLNNKGHTAKTIRITCYGNETNEGFDVSINNRLVQEVSLSGKAGDRFIDIDIPIPATENELSTNGKMVIRFSGRNKSSTARIFDIRLLQ
jgi:DUF1680 family protein